jgi:hypothetical protein
MKPTFEGTVSILVKAYLNETLEVGNYCACAVGNLIASATGAELKKDPDKPYGGRFSWGRSKFYGGEWYFASPNENELQEEQLQSIGYSRVEINAIEKAFERAAHRVSGHESHKEFAGLMAVVDVLSDIHGIDLETKKSAKLQFVKL